MTTFAPVPETKKTRILIILHLAVFLAGWTGIFGRLISLGGLPLVWYRMMVSVVVLASVLALMRRLHNPGWKGFSKILRMRSATRRIISRKFMALWALEYGP